MIFFLFLLCFLCFMKGIVFNDLKIRFLTRDSVVVSAVSFFLEAWFSGTENISVQTSGSTGVPKIIEVEKRRMKNSANMTSDFLGLKRGDKALVCLPTAYISGKMMVVRAIEQGMILYVGDTSIEPLASLEEIVDFCAMTPLQVEYSLSKLHLVRNLIIGGASVSDSLRERIRKVLSENSNMVDCKVYETYGMSETLSHIALKQIFPKEEKYFTVLEGVEVSTDARGCLLIHAPKLCKQRLQTNDIVEMKGDSMFRFLGRADLVINSGGAKIMPEPLETMVKEIISKEVLFIGTPDEVLGQKLILVVEGRETELLKSQISGIKYPMKFYKPKAVIFMERIPRTPNGKVDRKRVLEILDKN